MNKLLLFLGIVGLVIGGMYLMGSPKIPEFFIENSIYVLGGVIFLSGFIRFNKLFGIASMLVGILSGGLAYFKLLTGFLNFVLPYILVLIGIRFLIIGIFVRDDVI